VLNNNPFVFASSSASDPLAPQDAVLNAPAMPSSFLWMHLLVAPSEVVLALAGPPAWGAAEAASTAEPAPGESAAAVESAEVPIAAAIAVALAAPAPALVTNAEPLPLPASHSDAVPITMPTDADFDAYARLFQGIEDRDLLADLHANLAPGSDWANAFGPSMV
jgi:hypothetical protein